MRMLTIRPMLPTDLPMGRELVNQAGWNQTESDWLRFLELQPDGCFVAAWGGQFVGTVTTCIFDRVGWIGMLLVDKAFRRRGIGRALMTRVIEYLESRDVETIRLDATALGEPLYRTLGFETQFRLTRFLGKVEGNTAPQSVDAVRSEDWEAAFAFDSAIVGYARRRLLTKLFGDPEVLTFIDRQGETMQGYLCIRPGRLATYIGPCLAASEQPGRRLLAHARHLCSGQSVMVDSPSDHRHAVDAIQSFGLKPAREFIRMIRGTPTQENLASLWSSSGPEKG